MTHVGTVVYVAQDPTKLPAWSKDTLRKTNTETGTPTGNHRGNDSSRCTEMKDGLQGCSVCNQRGRLPTAQVPDSCQTRASKLQEGRRAHAVEVLGCSRIRSRGTYLECSCGFHISCKCARGVLEYLLATKQANQAQTQAYVRMAMWINATPQKKRSWIWECPKCEFNRDTGMAGWKRKTLAKAHAKVRRDMPKEVLLGQARGLRDCFVDIGGVCASVLLPFIQDGGAKCTDTLKVAVWSILLRVVAVPLATNSASVLKGMHASPISIRTITLLNAVSRNHTMAGVANCRPTVP